MNTAAPQGSADDPLSNRSEPKLAPPLARWSAQFPALRRTVFVAAAVLFVAVLSLAQAFLVPLALAAVLGFVLTSPVAALERRGVPRLLSVAVVVIVVLGGVVGFGYVLSLQFNDFASRLPQYSQSIKTKVATLREAREGTLGKMRDTIAAASLELAKEEAPTTVSPAGTVPHNKVRSVLVVPNEPNDVQRLQLVLTPVLTSIATAGVVLILVVFMLMQREDIRNRVTHLVGRGRVTVTTRALDDAGQRISKYLFSLSLINAVFGIFVAGGLLLIGVPYAFLWGMTAALLRFVPYLGSLLAMLMPAALAFVGSPGWGLTIETVVLFLGLDAVTAYVIEPLVIGTHTGVSSLALLVSAMFWTWLWGPVGLILSTPLTVCLTVIGKHIPEMEFLAVLLGDEPPIESDATFYQQLLAGNEDRASEILEQELSRDSRAHVFDRVAVPTLLLAERECLRGEISYDERQFVVHTLFEAVRTSADSSPPESVVSDAAPQHRILGVPARSALDHLVLEMLSQLGAGAWEVQQLSAATLVSEVLVAIDESKPEVIGIAALPPGGWNRARHLCKRVHERFPHLPILVLRAGAHGDASTVARDLTTSGKVKVAMSFTEAMTHLAQLLPPSTEQSSEDSDATVARVATHNA